MIEIDNKLPSPEEYNALRKSAGWNTFDGQSVSKGLKGTLYTVSVREDSELVAFGRVIGDGRIVFYIQDVIVVPGRRGLGYARIVMDHIMEYLHATAAKGAIVGLMASKGVEDMYKKYGFIERPSGKHIGAGMVLPVDWNNQEDKK
jgi:predicted GNAT family N-acyltransferase